jgi:hypothetical protein
VLPIENLTAKMRLRKPSEVKRGANIRRCERTERHLLVALRSGEQIVLIDDSGAQLIDRYTWISRLRLPIARETEISRKFSRSFFERPNFALILRAGKQLHRGDNGIRSLTQ